MKKIYIKLALISLFPIAIIINKISSFYPDLVERYYSTSFNKITIQILSKITSIVPFSIGEMFLYTSTISIIIYLIITIIKLFKDNKNIKQILLNFFLNISAFVSVLYFSFILLWGINYNRMDLNTIMEIDNKTYTVNELGSLYKYIVDKSNTLREEVKEDSNGVMKVNENYKDVLSRAYLGYDNASNEFNFLSGKYGNPKPILSSELFNYTGITGIYSPFTAEANVNIRNVDMMLPVTTLHEMAHQRGFAQEDEANFLGYLTAISHPDKDFQYSGYMLALVHVNNALYREDPSILKELNKNLSPKVINDIEYKSKFWEKYEGPVNEASSKMNDTYLKANGVNDGEKSYGRVVDLLLNYYYSQK